MTIKEALDYLNTYGWSQWKLGLSRTRELLERLGDPQKDLRFVHVAGSNGKGSTCAMIERILREAGYTTGFYPSPYIEDFRERIRYCGEYIEEEALCRITEQVAKIADSMEEHPTHFELITAIGMEYFRQKKCDIVVLEVGLGGTFDSTNIIDAPEAAVITNIGLEHTEYLGNTLAEIAGNKCGLIKKGSDVVCYENVPEVMEVVRSTCAQEGCPLTIASFGRIRLLEQSLEGQTFQWLPDGTDGAPGDTSDNDQGAAPYNRAGNDPDNKAGDTPENNSGCFPENPGAAPLSGSFRLALIGEYQLHNAAVALTTIEVLRKRGYEIPREAVRRGLEKVEWPARFEVLSPKPLFILDGGHNPQCAEALTESIRQYLPGRRVVFLMGMLADKDYGRVIDIVAPFAEKFVCLTPDSPRALPARQLAGELHGRGFEAVPCATVEEGILTALAKAEELSTDAGQEPAVIAFGSLYMAGAVRGTFFRIVKDREVAKNRETAKGL